MRFMEAPAIAGPGVTATAAGSPRPLDGEDLATQFAPGLAFAPEVVLALVLWLPLGLAGSALPPRPPLPPPPPPPPPSFMEDQGRHPAEGAPW